MPCPMREAGLAGPCGSCWQDRDGFEACCDEAAWWESLLNPQPVELEDLDGDDESEEHCDRCDDTGWIAVRNSYPMSYVGPGPCPDYATGVCDAPCDRCDRGYENRRRRMGLQC
jgi:hypothetical protein